MIRKTIFWAHLISGLCAGAVILMMSLTGVTLTYERQILHWFERSDYASASERSLPPVSIDALLEIGAWHDPAFNPDNIVITNHPGAPVALSAGRAGAMQLNPYTGETMEIGSEGLDDFFSTVTGWHRWFNISGEGRSTARAVTGACNLMFLFLIVSGIYLWFPRIWKWAVFKTRLLLNRSPNARARDFNWHHVFGIWSAVPLALIVASATVFNYDWANNLVYQVYGEEPPQRGRGRGPAPAEMGMPTGMELSDGRNFLSYDDLMLAARGHTEQELGDWHSISMAIPENQAQTVSFSVNQGLGGQPHRQYSLNLSRHSGELQSIIDFSSQSPGQRTRSILRFLHTGEVLGFWGQTVAGLVSFASLLMVWTGFALAYRRLIKPLLRRAL